MNKILSWIWLTFVILSILGFMTGSLIGIIYGITYPVLDRGHLIINLIIFVGSLMFAHWLFKSSSKIQTLQNKLEKNK